MLIRWKTFVLLCLLELAILVAASPSPHGDHAHADDAAVEASHSGAAPAKAHSGGKHSHMHGGAPKTALNEVSGLLPVVSVEVMHGSTPPLHRLAFFRV